MNKMKTWKPNMEATKQRYCQWWQRQGVIVNMWEHFQQGVTPHADVAAPPPPRDARQKWFDAAWRADYLHWYVAHSSLKADMLPVANTQLGPGSLAAILGGVFEGGDDTIWIHPSTRFDPTLPFSTDHPNYQLHRQLLTACKQKAAGRYYVGMPDLMEGLDVLAALKGTSEVLMDMVMSPETVERQLQRINDIYFQVFDSFYDIIREGDEMAFCYFSAWAPGKMSKLQCDLSTMISRDDYLRFVQPFIREQCRRIPYTLYHLDGVGAMHHLPALLAIDELDAIQWTPGVGEPQGGSSKWYDLYRQILDGGKSILCSWVTLDELPALLDNVGTEGVHLEMDFHNEDEVEQALEIVARCRQASPRTTGSLAARQRGSASELQGSASESQGSASDLQGSASRSQGSALASLSERRILVLDGAMGTMIQRSLPGFSGCGDLLCLEQPDVIGAIHRQYLEAGAQLIETCTFNAQRVSLSDFGAADRVRQVNLAACRIAREAADEYTRLAPTNPRFVLGSIGPTSQTVTATSDAAVPLSRDVLRAAYEEQVEALIDGGVDALLVETIFDLENARVAIDAVQAVTARRGTRLPLMLSFSVGTASGLNMLGQDIMAFLRSLSAEVFSVGINCHGSVPEIAPLIRRLASETPHRVSFYPNAGQPDADGHYAKTPASLQADLWPLLEGHYINIVGGCCGTTDAHIAAMAQAVQPLPGLFLTPHRPGAAVGSQGPGSPAADGRPATAQQPSSGPLYDAVLRGDADEAQRQAIAALHAGTPAEVLINEQMIGAMARLGALFEQGKAFVPQLLMAGRAMKGALAAIQAEAADARPEPQGRVVIGTVKGDLHDIGKNLVASMLEGAGFEVINLGIDVAAETFVEEVRRHRPHILCLSALLTTTMAYMRQVIEALESAGLRRQVRVMVGGAPVTPAFATQIGADAYSDNANAAVSTALSLMKTRL